MSTPLSTPIRQAKLGISSTKSLPLANEYKKLLNEQYQRLWLKHQQDLDLIDDIRSYVKSRLSIERDYTQALAKLSRQHSSHIQKRFTLLQQCDNNPAAQQQQQQQQQQPDNSQQDSSSSSKQMMMTESEACADSRLQKRLANNGLDEPDQACTLYKVWSEHIGRLSSSTKNRTEQFEQLTMVVDKLKDMRSHKANIGKKCLDSHLKRIHEDILVSMVDVEKARKLYYEDESQAKKARENEEKIKKKRSGLLTKFTGVDLQAKKEKTSAQREANDIQSTQARNDYIMALAAANAHLQHYYVKDLSDFMQLTDDGVLDHCKIFMATLSECDLNSLKDALHHAQYWSKMINLTGSQKTNSIFLDCEQSQCLKNPTGLVFEACNSDPISSISLEHNADYALQHEIDKWFTWFKKECRNLSQLVHQLERCQRALAEGQKSIELNGQTVEDLEPKIIELKQQIRKSEAAKLKAQARLKVIKEGGMQIEEWSVVESEIRADMLRAQEELDSKRLREVTAQRQASSDSEMDPMNDAASSAANNINNNQQNNQPGGPVLLHISKDSDGSDLDESMHNLATVSRSTSNLMDKQQKAISGYSALTDPSLVWQDDYSSAWNSAAPTAAAAAAPSADIKQQQEEQQQQQAKYNHLETSNSANRTSNGANNTVQSSSPLSAIMEGNHGLSTSPYHAMGEAYKSDYECDYNRTTGGHHVNSAASSAEPFGHQPYNHPTNASDHEAAISEQESENVPANDQQQQHQQEQEETDVSQMIGRLVIAQYTFDKTNEDDLSFVEGDILRVIEVSDSNWLQARNQATGEQGFIPAPYVKLLPPEEERRLEEEEQQQQQQTKPGADTEDLKDHNFKYESYVEDSNEPDEDENLGGETNERADYCRALYDYQPEADTYEPDGLPHLALAQGEILKVLDQGEEDGWWLVEKDNGTKGHVPSMLVEELEEGDQGGEGAYDEEDEGEASEYSDYPDLPPPPPTLPNIEPPKLEDDDQNQEIIGHVESGPPSAQAPTGGDPASLGASLVPTSFIIIEPTPEVESRSIESKLAEAVQNGDDDGQPRQASEPAPPKGYSVINEDFVLEGPSRKPSQLNDINDNNNNSHKNNYEPLSQGDDSSDIPAPPSVVIESFEVEKHESSSSADEDERDQESQSQPAREIRHTGNVDVNPMLRMQAEEFTKQIIAEAIAMTPRTDQKFNNENGLRYDQYNGMDDDLEDEEGEEVNQ